MARSKGSGTLVKRGKFFMAKWIVDGKIHTRSTKCTEKRAALEKLEEFVHPYQVKSEIETLQNLQSQIHILEGEQRKTPIKNAIRIKFAIDEYQKDLNVSRMSQKTIDRYTSQMHVLEKFLGYEKAYLYQITKEDAENFLKWVRDKKSISTYNTYLRGMKCIFKVLMKHDSNIRVHPFASFKKMKETETSYRRELLADEVKKLIECAGKKANKEWKLFFMLGAYTGMRKEDCQLLKKSEVNLDTGKIRRKPLKTRKSGNLAVIPIAPELLKPLKAAMSSDGEYVLPKMSQYTVWSVNEGIKDIFKAAGIETGMTDEFGKKHHLTGFHAFRHTFAKKLFRLGLSVPEVMRIMGHKTYSESLEYGAEDDINIPSSKLSAIWDGEKTGVMIDARMKDRLLAFRRGDETASETMDRILREYAELKSRYGKKDDEE